MRHVDISGEGFSRHRCCVSLASMRRKVSRLAVKRREKLLSDVREREPPEGRRHSAALDFHSVADVFPLLGLPGQHGAAAAAGQTGARGCQVGSHTPNVTLSFI